jgi:hypothetical protein
MVQAVFDYLEYVIAPRSLPGYDEAVSGHGNELRFDTRFDPSGKSKLSSNPRNNRPRPLRRVEANLGGLLAKLKDTTS